MKIIRKILLFGIFIVVVIAGCEEIKSYPDTPSVKYAPPMRFFITTDALGNELLLGKLKFEFTDGDGDLGLNQPTIDTIGSPDSLIYSLYLDMYEKDGNDFVKVENSNELNFRIPYLEREGQNKTLTGTITVDLEYRTLEYDTIFYTFYIVDRQFNRSNTDTTEVLVFTAFRDSMDMK